MASTSAGGITNSLTEACTESSPRGNNKNLKLRVDEYDMAKMEAILKKEIAEIDRKLDKQYFPSNINNNNNNSNSSSNSRSKARKTTLSNDPNELRHIQLKKSGEQDEPTMFKKNQQVPKPLTRTLSKDPREMMEIEKNVVDRNSDRNLLGVVPKTGPVSNKVTPRKKNCTLTNDIREQRDTDKRRKALSTHCTPYGSTENLADAGNLGEVFDGERVGAIVGGNTILGVSDPDSKGPRRRHFSTNHVELRDLERYQTHNDTTRIDNNQSGWPKSQPQTPRAKRKTLTNDAAEMRKVQEKENLGGEEEFAIGFKKNQPRVGPLSALVSKEKHHNLFSPGDDTDSSIGMMPRTCPNTPVMSKRRVTTLSNDSGEIQKIRQKYDPDKWNSENNDDLPRVILNGPNQCKARPKQMSLATNDFDMKRIQARTGQIEGLAHIFGSPAQRCQKFEPNGTSPAEDAVTDFLQFGKSGGGAPLRDKDGRLITGVGGKFKKDYYNLNKDPETIQKQKADQNKVLEEAKAMIEGNRIKKKSAETHDQRVSVDLADKIRKLDSIGYNKPDRTHARATSDVTRTKLDIRYPTESEARQYYENLKQQEADNKSRRNSAVNPGDIQAQKNGHVSSEGIRNGLVYGQNDVTPQRDARIMKLGTSLGQPQCGEVSVSSKYDAEGRKLQTPFATDN